MIRTTNARVLEGVDDAAIDRVLRKTFWSTARPRPQGASLEPEQEAQGAGDGPGPVVHLAAWRARHREG